jgi:hypothetical protein
VHIALAIPSFIKTQSHKEKIKGCFVKTKQPFVRMKRRFSKIKQPFVGA